MRTWLALGLMLPLTVLAQLRNFDADFDDEGRWAASGTVIEALLSRMLSEPYFALPAPKSTGRDLFNASWLAVQLRGFEDRKPADVQATLTELTARTCCTDALQSTAELPALIVCGGGALNTRLMDRLRALLPGTQVTSSTDWGLPPLQVEAAAFAWLARKTVRREKLDLTSTTGARGARVLGGVYPA